MTVLYDAGLLVAADRNERDVWADHRVRLEVGVLPVTTAPVVAQVSRSPLQIPLRRFLRGCDIVGFVPEDAHEVGGLLAKAGSSDVVDGHVVVIAGRSGSTVLTSDEEDRKQLSSYLPGPVVVERVGLDKGDEADRRGDAERKHGVVATRAARTGRPPR